MRLVVVLTAFLLGAGGHAFAQSSSSNQPGTQQPTDTTSGGSTNPGSAGANPSQAGANNNPGATTTGTAAPNITGSSGSSGTNGVDSGTSESH
jgi:hypothetical protein